MTKPVDLARAKTIPLKKRPSKVAQNMLARPAGKGTSFSRYFSGLPDILAVKDLKNLVHDIYQARKSGRPVLFMMGAHVIKCGLSPVVIDLMRRKLVTAIATNGACPIHDFELSFCGQTSEDVASALNTGTFGMAKETGEFINGASSRAFRENRGFGEIIGEEICNSKFPWKRMSIFAEACRLNVPATVHVAIGTDIVHQHPNCDGAALGFATYKDFQRLTKVCVNLEGGVVLNFGSAVIMPEVFLKALNLARNIGGKARKFTAANFDMFMHYRPRVNVLERPTLTGGKKYNFVGHHEIMLPLLRQALIG